MKIHQLLTGISIMITNEERDFIKRHADEVSISSLQEHDLWIAQNLVRKGVYDMVRDNLMTIKK